MNTAVSQLPINGSASDVDAEIQRIFELQRDTAIRLRTSTARERIEKIKRLRDTVVAYSEAFYEAAEKDFKKPPAEVDLSELMPVIAEANDAIRHVKKWMKPKGVWPTRLMMGTKAWIKYEPKGRTLIISPWNYPVNLTFGPLVSAIAAGNTAILKPSEMTPNLSALMVKITREIFSEDEVAIFEGDASVSTSLLALPFDHIFFTGSPAIGKVVMGAAAKHLTSVTLELGGKSPTIIDKTADLKMAARNIAWGKFTNNGQTCIAPDHVYVHEDVKDEFVRHMIDVLHSTYGATADEQLNSEYLARVVNERHTGRIKSLLEDAREQGAEILCGGEAREADCFVQPTLLTKIPDSAKIMDEEIFGPLLPIIGYTDLDAVIREINAMPKPLALYVWSKTNAHIDKVLNETSSGGACVNHTVVQFLHLNLPFGGVNNSGIGNGHGHFGFKAFSHERGVIRTRFALAPMMFPPYTDRVKKMIKLFMKTSI